MEATNTKPVNQPLELLEDIRKNTRENNLGVLYNIR